MSDPAVYNDHREAAEVGRRLKELESAAQARRASGGRRSDDLEAARDDPRARSEVVRSSRRELDAARGGAEARARRDAIPPTRRT